MRLVILILLAGGTLLVPVPCAAGEPDPEQLIKQLGADEYRVREEATRKLRALGTAARAALEKGVRSKDPEVRERAGMLLSEIVWKLPPELAARLGEFGRRFSGYVKASEPARLQLLSDLRSRAPAEAEPYLLQAAKEQTGPQARAWLAGLLGIYRSAAAEKALLAASRGEDRFCRAQAATALGGFEGKKATARLLGMAIDDDPTVRRAALQALGRRGPLGAGAAPAVLKRLGDVDETVRAAAAEAAGRIGDRRALEALWKLTAASEGSVSARVRAIEAAGRLAARDEKRVAARLAKLLDDPLPAVRSTALAALVDMRARSALPKLTGLLGDGDPDIADGAAGALGILGGKRAREALREALAGAKSESLRIAAGQALLLMGEKGCAPKVAKMMFGRNAITASVAAQALGATGELKWAARLAKAEEHWKSESFRLTSLQVRAGQLRDPQALGPLAELMRKERYDLARASFLADRGLPAEAAAIIEEAVKTDLDQPRNLSHLGTVQVQAARGGPGLAKLRLAVRMDPFDALNLNNLAWFLLVCPEGKLRRPVEALGFAERAARLEPRLGYILDTYAWALYMNGRNKQALAAIERAISWARADNPGEDSILRAHRARILAALGRRDEALKELTAVLARYPRDPDLAVEAARAYCDLGLTRKALGELGRVLELGRPALETLRLDPELAPARKSPDFKKLLERAAADRRRLKARFEGAPRPPRPGEDAGDVPVPPRGVLPAGGGGGGEE